MVNLDKILYNFIRNFLDFIWEGVMELKNSYIFLKRKKENNNIKKSSKENVIAVSFTPSLKKLLKRSFQNISFNDKEDNFDMFNSGSFYVNYNNKEIKVLFKYHNVWSNYYLDVIVNSRRKQEVIEILDIVNSTLIGKENVFDEHYVSIVSYDYISEYYCNKLFPYLNEFERKLRKVLFCIYTLNFNLEYYSATTSEEFQKGLKEKSKKSKEENIPKDDCYIKLGFYSLDYSDIDKLLFTKSITDAESMKLKKFLEDNDDLSKLNDAKIRETFNLCVYRTDWERFFDDKKFDDDFQKTLNDIRNFRNNIAHCKFISKIQYQSCIQILKKSIKSLDMAIKITEEKDFINKSIELQHESFNRLANMMRETIFNAYKPMLENVNAITQPMKELSQKLSEIVKPISSMIANMPNIVLPEIELPKFNIPNYFENIKNDEEKSENEEQQNRD